MVNRDWKNISDARAKQIIKKYETDEYKNTGVSGGKYLFNWCEEYKQFINDCVCYCVTSEIDYILKKSWEDSDAPLSYEDLDLFDIDTAREQALYLYDENEEEYKEYSNDPDTFNRKVKNKGDFEVFLNSLDKEELKELCENFNIDRDTTDAEIYEWWIISDPLKYRLEQEGEIFLNKEYWGRQTTGQGISQDSCCLDSFINLLKDKVRN
jgi:hypothetical protein